MIPYGMEYTSSAKGAAWKTVTCEFCPQDFAYRVERAVSSKKRSVLFLNNTGARQEAQSEAEYELSLALRHAVDGVACPNCGNYQSNMIGTVRLHRVFNLYAVAIAIGVFWAILAIWRDALTPLPLAVAIIIAVGATVRRFQIQPNADAAKRIGTNPTDSRPVMLRSEYERGIEQMVAQGAVKSSLLTLSWRRRASEIGSSSDSSLARIRGASRNRFR
jgi:hypothetical protein